MKMGNDLVYVVHSESAVAAALSEGLHDSGFEVVSMTTVTEAQDIINGHQFALPDAILTPLGGVEVGDSIWLPRPKRTSDAARCGWGF
jgi:DNA-binding response OmpR family regulator